ncbi:UDP-glucose--hexose-1-phosphate uridylyltransferase [Cytobacillus praedii]|uniref:UDP-glucose--hexose-1-phosphate uridylyltransferase n=1 Tax=Cytobacillus praedii TaxID=1742358 RepID=UPI001A980BB1|nr:UDP-glucose--hexose-1-phosphate uridylyltransferase [Cytobacillus praedii]
MINQWVQQLINQAFAAHLIEQEDVIYARNQVLSLLRLAEFIDENEDRGNDDNIPDLLEKIVDYACAHRIIEDVFDEKEIFSSKLMNVLIARPSAVNQIFYDKYEQSPVSATEYFYELSKNSQYIHMKRIRQNIEYKVDTEYGELDITINLSKPEKDPKSIELEQMARNMNYPKCLLCIENEGYAGRIGHPARSNHRMIRLNLHGDSWYLQFSPYVYYQEHCIVLSEKHTDMVISAETFLRLLTFVEKFPHYFLGSNAELPIVGGSILSHEHYQGGHYEFAMAKADSEWTFELARFPDVECSIVKWPMSVIRLRSKQIQSLVEAGAQFLEKWRNYSDEALEIIARTDEIPHNTITPIARKKGSFFELDVVLRNNRTNEDHPLGIFHPHEDVHHIKKENIGLIEVMGLAVLPARLKEELEEVKKYILGEVHMVADYHIAWAEELKGGYQSIASEADIDSFVSKEVGKKFLKALEDAAVFKRDEEGREGFQRFISACQSD